MTALDAELQAIRAGTRPILIGPWLSEVGFELLYWIPFLRKALAGIPPERLWVVSRGGCRYWYADLTPNYLELYDRMTPAELSALNRRRIAEQAKQGRLAGLRKGQVTAKQFYLSVAEQDLIAATARDAGLRHPVLLHPSMMYRAFRPFWKRKSDLYHQWASLTRCRLLMAEPSDLGLPSRYLAVKFYVSEAHPNTTANQRLVQQLLRYLSDHVDVVLLHTGTAYDEHGEFDVQSRERIHRVSFPAATNLDLQTRILAGSVGFIGTYGGFAYLAPFLGVPTVATYGELNFRKDHYRLMTEVAKRDLHTRFAVTRLEQALPLLQQNAPWMAHAA